MTDLVGRFERSATDVGCTVHRTPVADADAVLRDVTDPPAVGTPLPFDGVSLPEAATTDPVPSDLESATTGVTAADFGVAESGSVGLAASPAGEAARPTEPVSLYPEHHVAVLAASDLERDVPAGFDRVGEIAADGGDVVLATGPSATADMGELVQGAHGPRAVTVVVLEDR